MEKIKLTVEEQESIIDGDDDNFEIVQSEVTSKWRHGNVVKVIVKRLSDGKFNEVFKKEKTVIVYE